MKSLAGPLRWGVAAGTVLLSCGVPLDASAAAFDSPAGTTWDVVMNGRHRGLALITFNDDGTFSAESILVPRPPVQPSTSSDDSRGTGGNDSRNGLPSVGETNIITLPSHTNLFGHFLIPLPDTQNPDGSVNHVGVDFGHWGFDGQGRLVGFYTDVSGYDVCVTNIILVNTGIGIITNLEVDCSRLTNAISFTGSVVPGKRLTLRASTPDGPSLFSGVPVTTNGVPDISGNWTGTKIDQNLPYTEFFTMTRNDPAGNSYFIQGGGPGYLYAGTAFLSKSGQFALSAIVNPSDNTTEVHGRAVFGTLNKRKPSFQTGGLDELSGSPENRIKFNGVRTGP